MSHVSRDHSRRGAAVVAVIVSLILLSLVMVGMVLAGARDQDLNVQRMSTIRAFYAAEAGINMGMREIMFATDEDSDGGIGSISDDGDNANNPAFGTANVLVSVVTAGAVNTLTSSGNKNAATRDITAVINSNNGAQMGYTMAFGSEQKNADDHQVATKVTLDFTTTVTKITAYVNGPPPKLIRYAVYADDAGEPGALIVQSYSEAVNNNTFHWHTLYVPSTTFAPGTYWLALGFEHSNVAYAFDAAGGQTRWNGNDAVSNGFNNPWGLSTSASTQRVSIYANSMADVVGPMTFSDPGTYDNDNPQSTGLFRDITNPTMIQSGSDVSSNTTKYSAINFTTASGLVADCMTTYDTTPSVADQTDFSGNIRVSADVLVIGTTGVRWIGFGVLMNEIAGQNGIMLALTEGGPGNNDRLQIFRLPQNADISAATYLAQTDTFNAIAENDWYRLVMDMTVEGSSLTIDGRVFSHTTANNPNSAVNSQPLASINYTASFASLSGLQNTGEVCLVWDTSNSASQGSITNIRIDSGSGIIGSATLSSWTEVEP